MNVVSIGKEGSQPFKITNKGVSRHHATITISDNGRWSLEDQNSANGTYIRNEQNGEMIRVGTVDITPMTFICLGPDNAQGCSFYARQVLKENYNTYREEYEYLAEITNKYDARAENVEKNIKRMKWLAVGVNVFIIGISLLIQEKWPEHTSLNFNLLRVGSLLTSLMALLYDGAAIKRKIEKERTRFYHCPNPNCSHTLRAADILNYQCPRCKQPS